MTIKWTFNPFTANFDAIDSLANPLLFKGNIALNTDFPLIADVQTGWFYTVSASVTDNVVDHTATGQSFISGDEIAWNGTNWSLLGNTSAYVRLDGTTTGATSQAQTFTNGVITGKVYPSSDSTTAVGVFKANGTTNVLNVDTTNGRISVGTTAPLAPLHLQSSYAGNHDIAIFGGIYGGQYTGPAFRFDNVNDGTGLLDETLARIRAYDANGYTGGLIFETGSAGIPGGSTTTEVMRIQPNGNVGIGTTAPGTTLDVRGNITILAGSDIRPTANSTTAINIAQADGTDFVTFDSTNKIMSIGAGNASYGLTVATVPADACGILVVNAAKDPGIRLGYSTSALFSITARGGSPGYISFNYGTLWDTQLIIHNDGSIQIGAVALNTGRKLTVTGNSFFVGDLGITGTGHFPGDSLFGHSLVDMVLNGSFETDTSTPPTSWANAGTHTGTAQVDATAPSGANSVRITCTGAGGWGGNYFAQTSPLVAGKSYRWSYYAKKISGTSSTINFGFQGLVDTANNQIITGSWAKYTGTFLQGSTPIRFGFLCVGTDIVFDVDLVTIYDEGALFIDESENYVAILPTSYTPITNVNFYVNGNMKLNGGFISKVTTVTNTYTILVSDSTIVCNKTTAFTVTLPTGVVGAMYRVKNIGVGVVTVSLAGDTIDGETSQNLNQYDSMHLQCSAANTWIIL